jgi:DNA (cytosine-5)-methyltransferase 1
MSQDQEFLRSTERPPYETGEPQVRVVDLFSGCGGMTLGVAESAHELGIGVDVTLAVDFDEAIARVYGYNFPKARVEAKGVEEIFDGQLSDRLTPDERTWKAKIGPVSWLQGGPPCQGHSDLNNHTRRDDPRNEFYGRMARAAEVLAPHVVVVENVPTVRNDKGQVVQRAISVLERAGYRVADEVMSLAEVGVPQRRRRHTLLAVKDLAVDPQAILSSIGDSPKRDLKWAIEDLIEVDDPSPLDTPSRMSVDNLARIEYLRQNELFDLPNAQRPDCHQGDHSYKSMYGRLKWDEPAQTITSGFGSMGQGRYVHPSESRTLTPHEAARIQFFPDWFDFTGGGVEMRRGIWATMIGNAVPPKLTMELGRALLPHLDL